MKTAAGFGDPGWLALLGVGLLLTGCAPETTKDSPVVAKTTQSYYRWRADAKAVHPPEAWQEFDAALQEIRMATMRHREATGHDAVEAALYARIDGQPFDQVLRDGYGAQWERLREQRHDLAQMAAGNDGLLAKPGDVESAHELAALRDRHTQQLAAIDADLDRVGTRLKALGGAPPPSVEKDAGTKPLTREEVLAQLAELIDKRRQVALLNYGAWPIQLDRGGFALANDSRPLLTDAAPVTDKAAKHAVFDRASADAVAAGEQVAAVRLKDIWRLYRGPAALPDLSPALLSLLTPADRADLAQRWFNLEAELWARQSAKGD